ncbi:WecB/TagA/CpsF family glycosyltransferase [Arthrobacter halodurans]|uniref:WecB/TagA/CpsF family glycosyltransferase n=1 Tax=Arthrobacter halodurans TaxID=516699 RepID=A0ABV4UKU3_9MICC
MKSRDTAWIAGVRIDRMDMQASVRAALDLIESGTPHQHVVVNAAKLVAAQNDPALMEILNGCSLINADGQSVVWASRLLRDPLPERVAGIDFMNELIERAHENNLRIYLLGASSDVVEKVATEFERRGANVVGYRNGYWGGSTSDRLVAEEIAALNVDVLFVAIPSPAKEIFLQRYLDTLNVGLAVGVGGSFDVVAGKTSRAPRVLQRLGLEWLFRLAQEPRRMARRYFVGNSKMVLLILRSMFRRPRGARIE